MNNILLDDMKYIYNCDLDWLQFKNSTIMITGITGMVGLYIFYFFSYLNIVYPDLNINIIGVCRNKNKFENLLDKIYRPDIKYSIYEGKVENIGYNIEIDYIFHTASPASSDLYKNNPISVILPNVIGTKKLLDIAKSNKSKMVFFSSGEVSGKIDKEFISEKDYGYLDPTDIRSCYGESKRLGETLCFCYNHQYNVHVISVRLDHTYGLTLNLDTDTRVFSDFIRNIINNEDIIIKSDGSPIRTFVYLADVVKGIFISLLKGKSGESYNLSNNNCRVSIKQLAEILIDLYQEKNLKISYLKRNTNNYLENKNTICSTLSTEKIELLGYKPTFTIEKGFRRTIDFLKDIIWEK